MKSHLLCVAGNPELQDRTEIFSNADRFIIALADGAGGISGGAQAAEAFVRIIAEQKSSVHGTSDCVRLLRNADQRIADDPAAGETTAILLVVDKNQIYGASVGDSEACLFSKVAPDFLTKGQRRKPFLGSGGAVPIAFESAVREGILVAATDGLWKYTSREKIEEQIHGGDPSNLAERLVDLVRLASGVLQDDIAIAVVELP